ncbi:uncharacterized protein N7459_008154 [Penicillium hispanicum]|uniref:uncharacterized protein n=1 Tax=Penicillium hispanicum TaxID=1080232 RepID=UPI002541FAE8|nr:uncharacterized protein N7459_008154 [Penicillium hispanicum]KAJ5573727.1 hypothetical protein N7459_008154 [Penicillium hispanicum]
MAMFKGSQDRRAQGLIDSQEGMESELDSDEDTEARMPKRPRRYTSQTDFVDSSRIQIGSSSPPHDGSYDGSQESSLGYVDRDAHYLGIMLEDDTVRLASCVIRHILYFAPPQNASWKPTVVEFRDAKTRLAAATLDRRQIVAIDDGGLCLRQQEPGRGFILVKNHIAILEAKTQFQCVRNGQPIISDKCSAQMICEALAARLSDQRHNAQQSVIIINATQHYMCFLQLDISHEYINDFESVAPTQFLYVSSTPWFDLSQRSGRENVVANLCAIMRRETSG